MNNTSTDLLGSILLSILPSTITAIVTILGLVANYIATTKNFEKQIKNKKTDIYLKELAPLPYELIMFQDELKVNKNTDDSVKKLRKLHAKVFAYGSEDAIKILSAMQQHSYQVKKDDKSNEIEKVKPLAYLIILCCQLKYEATGLKINPTYWYKIKLNDYHENEISNNFLIATNDIVKELKLSDFLRVE